MGRQGVANLGTTKDAARGLRRKECRAAGVEPHEAIEEVPRTADGICLAGEAGQGRYLGADTLRSHTAAQPGHNVGAWMFTARAAPRAKEAVAALRVIARQTF